MSRPRASRVLLAAVLALTAAAAVLALSRAVLRYMEATEELLDSFPGWPREDEEDNRD